MKPEENLDKFCKKMTTADVDIALVTDEDNIYYLTGYYDYLHMDFGRPTILIVQRGHGSTLVTPAMESDMATASAKVDRIVFWNDGVGNEWREELGKIVSQKTNVGIEKLKTPPLVHQYLTSVIDDVPLSDVSPILDQMRMIKNPQELQLARHAGHVAMAMMNAGRNVIGPGVPEYEVAMATSTAGTRKAAELLSSHYQDDGMSPNTHFLQIMASGKEITKPHHRATTRLMEYGEPVFLCFCGMTNFHRFKLGFDRTFWIGEIKDPDQAEIYDVALRSQAAALSVLGPGIKAESVHAAYAEVIQEAGFEFPFRCGRATGYSFLETPQLVQGDETVLQPGMVFAVDGSVTAPGKFRAQVGDSFIITENGYEQITWHPNNLEEVVIPASIKGE